MTLHRATSHAHRIRRNIRVHPKKTVIRMCTVRETVVLVFPEAEICFPGFPGFSSRRLILGANYWSKIRNNWFFDYMHNFFLLITPVYGYCSVATYTVIILLQITLFSFHRWVESLSVFAVTTQFIWVSSVISFF